MSEHSERQDFAANESGFLSELFLQLNASGVRYAVMRNHQQLPRSLNGSDLDLLIAPRDAACATDIVFKVVEQTGGAPVGTSRSRGFMKVYVLGKNRGLGAGWWGVRLDLNFGLYYRGLCLLDIDAPWPVSKFRDISVLDDGFAGVLGMLKELLNNDRLSQRYLSQARTAATGHWPAIQNLLAPMGMDALARLHEILLEMTPPGDLARICGLLRRTLIWHAIKTRAVVSAWGVACFEWSKAIRYWNPAGKVIAILGVDGAGKSTAIDAILPVLNAATHKAVFLQHLRPKLLPPLARFKINNQEPAGVVTDPHGSEPSGILASWVRLAYLTIDYVLGYWLWTRPRIARQPAIVLFDRYFFDMALDPRRFRIGLPEPLIRRSWSLIPMPDLIVCLHGSPETIAARKGELPLAETQRQVDALVKFSRTQPRAVLVSTEGTVQQTRDDVLESLLKLLKSRSEPGERK
jgi:thymidylate kinase